MTIEQEGLYSKAPVNFSLLVISFTKNYVTELPVSYTQYENQDFNDQITNNIK